MIDHLSKDEQIEVLQEALSLLADEASRRNKELAIKAKTVNLQYQASHYVDLAKKKMGKEFKGGMHKGINY